MDYVIVLEPTDKNRPALISIDEIREAVRPYVYESTQNKFKFVFQGIEFEVSVLSKKKNTKDENRLWMKSINNGESNTGIII